MVMPADLAEDTSIFKYSRHLMTNPRRSLVGGQSELLIATNGVETSSPIPSVMSGLDSPSKKPSFVWIDDDKE